MITRNRVADAATALRILGVLLMASCAGQAPPPGGPEDRTPPEIVSSSPAPYSLNYTEKLIAIEFSEYVDRRSVEGAIFVSPDVGPLEFDWSGREVEVTFTDSLRANTTYVITIGTDVVDIRNRNRMARAFQLAFSTGTEIDRGAIAGVVYPESNGAARSGVIVNAYRLDGLDPDTLNPQWTRPDYVTQTGAAGEFVLAHLRLGRYRLLALRDEYRNLLYEPQTDAFGLLAGDITLNEADTLVTDVAIKLTVEDTTAPTLIKAVGASARLVEVEFSEPLREQSIAEDAVTLTDTVSGSELRILAMSVRPEGRNRYVLATEVQDSLAVYRLTVTGVRDSAGNEISPIANSLTFKPEPGTDTTVFQVVGFSVRDSSRSVDSDAEIEIAFNRPAQRTLAPASVTLADTLGRTVPVDLSWRGSLALVVRPARSLIHDAWYVLALHEGNFSDVFSATGRDTVLKLAFQVISDDQLGSIEGTVVDENPGDQKGPVVVFAQPVDKDRGQTTSRTIPGAGPFVLPKIREGRYRLGSFRDRNGNALFDPGTVYPYEPSERYRIAADTLRVRARWPYEGAVVRLR